MSNYHFVGVVNMRQKRHVLCSPHERMNNNSGVFHHLKKSVTVLLVPEHPVHGMSCTFCGSHGKDDGCRTGGYISSGIDFAE